MIKIYGMQTCPDCTYVEEQVKGNSRYEIIDIGQHVRNLKEFLKLRDHNPVFDAAKKIGAAGIPCFVLEDGTVTLTPKTPDYSHTRSAKELHVTSTEAVVEETLNPLTPCTSFWPSIHSKAASLPKR